MQNFVHKVTTILFFQENKYVRLSYKFLRNQIHNLITSLTRVLENTSPVVKLKMCLARASATICVFCARCVTLTFSRTSRIEARMESLWLCHKQQKRNACHTGITYSLNITQEYVLECLSFNTSFLLYDFETLCDILLNKYCS